MLKKSKGTGTHDITPATAEAARVNWVIFCLRGIEGHLQHSYLKQYLSQVALDLLRSAVKAAIIEAQQTSITLKEKRNGKTN